MFIFFNVSTIRCRHNRYCCQPIPLSSFLLLWSSSLSRNWNPYSVLSVCVYFTKCVNTFSFPFRSNDFGEYTVGVVVVVFVVAHNDSAKQKRNIPECAIHFIVAGRVVAAAFFIGLMTTIMKRQWKWITFPLEDFWREKNNLLKALFIRNHRINFR